jgi:hypothetical protein
VRSGDALLYPGPSIGLKFNGLDHGLCIDHNNSVGIKKLPRLSGSRVPEDVG